jgi:hypothetical protein
MSKKLSTEIFIQRSRVTHDDRYGYENVIYTSNKNKVKIFCNEHGLFEQRPDHHLSGVGCPKCANNIKIENSEFIEAAKIVHGDRFDYSNVVYAGKHSPVIIKCSVHGNFFQTPSNHLQNKGCDKCRPTSKSDSFTFIDAATKIHGEKYNYSKVDYSTAHSKVSILCYEHGEFRQTPNSHLNGSGCPKCSVTGFDPSKIAYGYIIKFSDFIKFGITNNIENRLGVLKRKNGNFQILKIKEFELGKDAVLWENSIKKKFGGCFVDKIICPDGFTETLSLDLEITLIEGL